MSAPLPAPLAFAALFGAAWLLSGCGDPELWERYRAERGLWLARRSVDRIRLDPRLASATDYDRAAAALESITARFPAAVWATPERTRRLYARDVATVSGRAAIGLARLAQVRGQRRAAVEGFERVMHDYQVLPAVVLEAAVARARTLERVQRYDEASQAWRGIARDFAPLDPETGLPTAAALEAPRRFAEALAACGDHRGADSTLRQAAARDRQALPASQGRGASRLWLAIAELDSARGDHDGALAALRAVLGGRDAAAFAPRVVLELGELSLTAGRPDSARAYAGWAASDFHGAVRAQALVLDARATELAGPPDSAVAVYGRALESLPAGSDGSAIARFRRAVLLDGLGRWEQARTEYRTLSAENPSHPLALRALVRIVTHHAGRGEKDLARIEGARAEETIARLLAENRDPEVQLETRRARADILEQLKDAKRAQSVLRELWVLYPDQPGGMEAGLRAAEIAETELREREAALELYRDLAIHADNPRVRFTAASAIERLSKGTGPRI